MSEQDNNIPNIKAVEELPEPQIETPIKKKSLCHLKD
jgi:hypothetical protein